MASPGFMPELAPRYSADSGLDYPWPNSESVRSIAAWCEAAWEEAEADQKASEELTLIDKYVDYLAGRQWPGGMASYKAKPVNNRMARLFWELVSLLTDLRPIVDIRSTERDKQLIAQEDVLNKTTKSWWRNNRIDGKVAQCIVYALLSTGFNKLEWDPRGAGGMGDISLIPLGPRSVLPLKPGADLQSSEAVIFHDVKPVGWVKRKYPKSAHLVYADPNLSGFEINSGTPANVSPQLFQSLTPAFKRIVGKDSRRMQASSYPMCRYREFWIKDYTVNTSNVAVWIGNRANPYRIAYKVEPGEMFYPRGRLLVMAGKEVIEDSPNPYWHGLFPFTLWRLNVVPWQIYGVSDLRSWADLQDIVNQIYAGVMNMIKRAVNPPLLAPRNAMGEGAWNSLDMSMPGAKVAYSQTAAHPPQVVPSGQLPGFVLQFLQGTEREMDQQSNIAAINETVKKKQVPGGDTLDQIRSSQQTPVRMKGRNIEDAVCDNGAQLIPSMFQFYKKGRRVYMLGSMGKLPEDFDWDNSVPEEANPAEHIKKFKFELMEGSMLSIQRVEKVMGLYRLRLAGDIDRKTFFKMLDRLENIYFDVEEIEANLKKERETGLMGMPPKGKGKAAAGMGKVQ